jgi:CPA2 family monovalent cation:H+ antiporter-2
MIAGPYVLGWVKDPVTINDLSAIGVVLLLFIIGLELDPVELRRIAGRVGVIVTLEVGISFAAGYLASSYFLGTGTLQSIVFAMVASITSTAIVGKVFLEHRGALDSSPSSSSSSSSPPSSAVSSSEPKALMGIMIVEDMVAVVFLIALTSLTSDGGSGAGAGLLASGSSLLRILETIGGGAGLVLAGYLMAAYIAPRMIDFLSAFEEEYEEIPFLFALGLGFLFAVLAAVLGYSPGTGAFIIGLSIRGKRSKFLERRIAAIKDLFIVLFFISMGSLIDPVPALTVVGAAPLLGVMVLVVSGKFLGGLASSRILIRTPSLRDAYLFGSWLVPRGEFSFVIGQLALSLGIIDDTFFSLIGLVVLVTAIVGTVMQRFGEERRAPAMFPTKAETDNTGGEAA